MIESVEDAVQKGDCNVSHVENVILKTFRYLMLHDGAGRMEVSVKLLKRGQKEVLVHCGRTYRFVLDSELFSSSPGRDGGE